MHNDHFNWMTYESLFNKEHFRKPKVAIQFGLYLVPLSKVTICFREHLDPNLLEKLCDAFFPDLEPGHLRDMAKKFWPWKNQQTTGVWEQYGINFIGHNVTPPGENQKGNRQELCVYVDPDVVLPYNFYDNVPGSHAIGTDNAEQLWRQLKLEPKLWFGWKSASRSCVIQTKRVRPKGNSWQDQLNPQWQAWPFKSDHRTQDVVGLADQPGHPPPYDLSRRQPGDFSIKTGVCYVGREVQGGSGGEGSSMHKDVIGDWLLGALRSDYIADIDAKWNPPTDHLLILTELLTITEKKEREHKAKGGYRYREGIQVRDISRLDTSNFYLPPLCIPFLDLRFKTIQTSFSALAAGDWNDANARRWREFWKKAWAAALGRAKALFMLCYGLQHINPNPQNYLIEFKRANTDEPALEPTGRIVIRDLADASLHREVVWALFGGNGLPPQSPADSRRLGELNAPVLQFEFAQMARAGFGYQDTQETGSTPEVFGPPGTQFLWQRFSAFTNGGKIFKEEQKDPAYRAPIWQQLLATLADWGLAHNKAYVSTVEQQLGLNFVDIDWGKLADPQRYTRLSQTTQAQNDFVLYEWQKIPGPAEAATLKLGGVDFFPLPGTAPAWKTKFKDNPEIADSDALFQANKAQQSVWVIGSGIEKGATVSFGDQAAKPEEVFWAGSGAVYVKTTPERVELVKNRLGPITVTNPGAGRATARLVPAIAPAKPGDLGWEEMSAKIIHTYLASQEGQDAIRAAKGRHWQPVAPSATVRVRGGGDQPVAWRPVRLRRKTDGKEWTDLTDEKGEIKIYKSNSQQLEVLQVFTKIGGSEADPTAASQIQ